MGLEQPTYNPNLGPENKQSDDATRCESLFKQIYPKILRIVDDSHLRADQKTELLTEMVVKHIAYLTSQSATILND